MANRFYIVPIVTIVNSVSPYSASRTPKYISGQSAPVALEENQSWRCEYYGAEDVCIVNTDLTAAQHNTLAGYSDVWSFPENTATALTVREITDLSTFLNNIKIPAEIAATSITNENAINNIKKVINVNLQMHQRHNSNIFSNAQTLDTRLDQKTQEEKSNIESVALLLGEDISLRVGSTTNRQILLDLMSKQEILGAR